jgi:putative membrane protein
MEPLLAYLHYLSILLLAGFLTGELLLCRPGLDAAGARRLPKVDVGFFVCALIALATGLARLFLVKGWGFYTPNPVFWTKMALYVAIALISIRPTLLFIRWARAGVAPPAAEVATARRLIHVELGLLALMPLMAVLMARGVGLR